MSEKETLGMTEQVKETKELSPAEKAKKKKAKYAFAKVVVALCVVLCVVLTVFELGVTYRTIKAIDVDGTDLSKAMVQVCKEKAKTAGLKLNVFAGNMTNFKSNKKYSLAIIARSGFMHLITPEDQRNALLNIREHLTDGGILTLNTFAPHPVFQAEQIKTTENDYSFRLEYKNRDGLKEKIYNAISYDPFTQIMSGNWKFETYNDNGQIIDVRIRPLKMRQTYKQELIYLAELCGYEVLHIYGDYYKNEIDTGRYVWILKKK